MYGVAGNRSLAVVGCSLCVLCRGVIVKVDVCPSNFVARAKVGVDVGVGSEAMETKAMVSAEFEAC